MQKNLDQLSVGDFFTYEKVREEEEVTKEVELFQKIEPTLNYNCLLVNKGQLCNIYPNSNILNPVRVEFKIFED